LPTEQCDPEYVSFYETHEKLSNFFARNNKKKKGKHESVEIKDDLKNIAVNI